MTSRPYGVGAYGLALYGTWRPRELPAPVLAELELESDAVRVPLEAGGLAELELEAACQVLRVRPIGQLLAELELAPRVVARQNDTPIAVPSCEGWQAITAEACEAYPLPPGGQEWDAVRPRSWEACR